MAMSPEATKALILDLIQRILKSWWTVIAGASIGLAVAMVALNYVPRIYEARCVIFVAPQKLPKDFITLSGGDDMGFRLNALESAVLSRNYLVDLIDELDRVAPNYERPQTEEQMERAVKGLQRRVEVLVRRSARTFHLTFQDEDPLVAATVVNTLAQRFINENVNYDERNISGNLATLEKLADAARQELQSREEAISRFRAAHVMALTASMPGNLKQLEQKEKEWDANQRSIERLGDQLSQLRAQRDQASFDSSVVVPSVAPIDAPTARLQQLRSELSALKLKYSAQHPEVSKKQFELDQFLETYSSSSGIDESGNPLDATLSPIDAQIASQQREIARLEASQVKLKSEMATLNARVNQTPQNELKLQDMMRGMDPLRKRFDGTQAMVEGAKAAQLAIGAQQGEQFEVTEEAKVPRIPVQPKPMMIYGMGIIAGLVLFVAPMLIKRLLTPVITSEAALKEFARTPILFSIPRIPTTEGMRAEYWRRVKNIAFSGLSIVVLVLAGLFAFTDKLNF